MIGCPRRREGGPIARPIRRLPPGLALASALLAGGPLSAQSAYTGLEPVAGDAHQHAGSLIGNFAAQKKLGNPGLACPHEFGDPRLVFEAQRSAGYDWGSLAHHDRATDGGMTGDPHGRGAGGAHAGAYTWWTDPAATPLVPSDGTPPIAPSPGGLPDYVTGGFVSPGWSEALSLSSAADQANDPAGGFVAFAGREYTTDDPASPPDLGQAPRRGGHKVVLLPGPADAICGPLAPDDQGPANACDETDLYGWVHRLGGAIIQAHPAPWGAGAITRWHPGTARGGLSDVFVHGAEVGSASGLRWEHAFQRAHLDGPDDALGEDDLGRFLIQYAVLGDGAAGPKCAACGVDLRALPCRGDACTACNDGVDNDGDGAVDWPDDPSCASPAGKAEGPGTSCGLGPELAPLLALLAAAARCRGAFEPDGQARRAS